jgi:hypothetical protein
MSEKEIIEQTEVAETVDADALRICAALRPAGEPGPCLESDLASLFIAWNRVYARPEGPRVLHRLFGSDLGGKSGGHCFATRMDGCAHRIDNEELRLVPGVIAQVRGELEKAARVAAGLE